MNRININSIKPTLVVDSNCFSYLLNLIIPLTEDQSIPRHIVLFGGSTAIDFYKYVLEVLKEKDIDFSNIHFWFTDERMVSEDSVSSNYGEFKRHFSSKVPSILNKNLHPIYGIESGIDESIQKEISRITEETVSLVDNNAQGIPSFDLVILGMGADGHTASLFPNHFNIDESSLYVPASHPETGEKRISISLRIINAAKKVAVVAVGTGKKEKIKEILPVFNSFVQEYNTTIENNNSQDEQVLLNDKIVNLRKDALKLSTSPLVILSSSDLYFIFDDRAAAINKKLNEYKLY